LCFILTHFRLNQESTNGHQRALIGFFSWAGSVETGSDAIQGAPYSGTSPFFQVGAQRSQKGLDIFPGNIGPNWIAENRYQCFSVF
jgi:hypothetical protein